MEKDKKEPRKSPADYARYTGLAFEMMAIIGGLTWGAVWLDEQIDSQTPWFTIILSPLSVIIALFVIIRDLNRHS